MTLDDLSAEAMLESSQRVEQLADLFRRRVEPLPDPGPPQPLPGKPRTASLPIQVVAIILYDQLNTILNVFKTIKLNTISLNIYYYLDVTWRIHSLEVVYDGFLGYLLQVYYQ